MVALGSGPGADSMSSGFRYLALLGILLLVVTATARVGHAQEAPDSPQSSGKSFISLPTGATAYTEARSTPSGLKTTTVVNIPVPGVIDTHVDIGARGRANSGSTTL